MSHIFLYIVLQPEQKLKSNHSKEVSGGCLIFVWHGQDTPNNIRFSSLMRWKGAVLEFGYFLHYYIHMHNMHVILINKTVLERQKVSDGLLELHFTVYSNLKLRVLISKQVNNKTIPWKSDKGSAESTEP